MKIRLVTAESREYHAAVAGHASEGGWVGHLAPVLVVQSDIAANTGFVQGDWHRERDSDPGSGPEFSD